MHGTVRHLLVTAMVTADVSTLPIHPPRAPVDCGLDWTRVFTLPGRGSVGQ